MLALSEIWQRLRPMLLPTPTSWSSPILYDITLSILPITLLTCFQVNSTVPICAEIYKSKGVYNPKRLFGVTTLDVVRASRFVSMVKNTDPANENITVVGGHSGVTIVPLISQSGHSDITGEKLDTLVNRIQFGGDEVVKAKDGAGSATLSMAMAGARFAESLLKAAQGEKGVIECTFVDSPLYKDQGIDFFASKVELGPDGVQKIHDVGKLTSHEEQLLQACLSGESRTRHPDMRHY
jgi:malate dehydrogenase